MNSHTVLRHPAYEESNSYCLKIFTTLDKQTRGFLSAQDDGMGNS